jgi:hypothetical protein
MGMIQESLQGQPLQFVFPDFRNYQFSSIQLQQASTTQVSIPISAKFASLKALFATCRDKGTGALTFFPYSSVSSGIIDYQYRIGPTVMPSKAPSTLPEMFAEVVKAIGSISDLNYQPSIDKISYSLVNSAASNDTSYSVSTTSSGSFYIGIDLENYAGANKDSIFSGMNTLTDDTFLVINYAAQTAAYVPRYDIFANFDCVFIAENGTAYIKF